MAHIYTVTNQKGGAGKTTTVHAIGAGLSLKGYKTLFVDLDPQGNLSYITGAARGGASSYDVIMGRISPSEAVQHTESGDIIPSAKALSGADTYITDTGKEYRLREALESIQGLYDFILIDTPPMLGILTINALTASEKVIIPAQAEILSLQGIEQLSDTINPVRKYCNPKLEIEGIVLTRFRPRSVLAKEIRTLAGQLAEKMGTKVFETAIRDTVSIMESQMVQRTIYSYAPRATAAQDYKALVDEIIKGER